LNKTSFMVDGRFRYGSNVILEHLNSPHAALTYVLRRRSCVRM